MKTKDQDREFWVGPGGVLDDFTGRLQKVTRPVNNNVSNNCKELVPWHKGSHEDFNTSNLVVTHGEPSFIGELAQWCLKVARCTKGRALNKYVLNSK